MIKFKYLKQIIGLGLVVGCIILDQISKWLVLEHVFKPEFNLETMSFFNWISAAERLSFVSTDITSFFNLTMVWNEGISFGMFQNGNPWPIIIMSVVISGIFAIWLIKSKCWVETISLSLVIGGAIGNIIDRLHFRAVADFLDFHIMGHHYPAFNLADSFISIGIVILVVNSLFFASDKTPNNKEH